MALTYYLIASTTVGSGGISTIDFQNIPNTYTDLYLATSLRITDAANYRYGAIYINNTSTGITWRDAYFDGTLSSQNATDAGYFYNPGAGTATSTFSNNLYYFANYATSQNKTWVNQNSVENSSTTSGAFMLEFNGALWSNSAAINRITLNPYSGTFVQNSTAYLYGIKNS